MPRRPWWPAQLAEQVTLLNNFSSKIVSYAAALNWETDQATDAVALCNQMVAAIEYAEASKTTMYAVTQWRELVLSGDPVGASAVPIPTFTVPPALAFMRGCVQQFTRLRDQIVANNGYTLAMGENLGIVGAEITPPSPGSVSPNLKVTVTEGDSVKVTGSMQGMNALKMMYTPKGGAPREVAFITSTPAGFTISKTQPGVPENGELRAVFYRKNLPYGNQSPIYPITLS